MGAPPSREGTRAVAERTARVMKDSPYEEVMIDHVARKSLGKGSKKKRKNSALLTNQIVGANKDYWHNNILL